MLVILDAISPATALKCTLMVSNDPTKKLECDSDSVHIVMDIKGFLLANVQRYVDTQINYSIEEHGGSTINSAFYVYLCEGVSVPQRLHNSGTIITVPYAFTGSTLPSSVPIEVHDRFPSLIHVEPSTTTELGTIGKVTTSITSVSTSITITPNSPNSYLYGDIWDAKVCDNNNPQVLTLNVVTCVPERGVFVQYTDVDGCVRYAMGKILSDTLGAEQTAYGARIAELCNTPMRHIDKVKASVSVGFADVLPGECLEDIMLSKDVYMVRCGESHIEELAKMVPTTLSIERDGDTKDIVINFDLLG